MIIMNKNKTSEVQKVEAKNQEAESTRNVQVFRPNTDIVENEAGLLMFMDLPGATEDKVDIHLEDDVLRVQATIEEPEFEGYSAVYSEFEIGDFNRSFRLIDDFDQEKINAKMKDGVLEIFMPKSEKKKPQKILIKS